MLRDELYSFLRRIFKAYTQSGVCELDEEKPLYCFYCCFSSRESCLYSALEEPIRLLGGHWNSSEDCFVLGEYNIYIAPNGLEILGPDWEPKKWDEGE